MELNQKLINLVPYEPIKGEYKVRLDANESCFDLPDQLKKKILENIGEISFNRYPDCMADITLEAFADLYDLNKDYVTAGNGSDELISIITSCFFEKDDVIVTMPFDFSMYSFYGSMYELNVKVFDKNEDLSIDVDKLIDFCNENKAKALIFSNPCNPTSLGLDKNEVRKIIKSLNCFVILDEAYMDFWDQSLLSEIEDFENCIILKTCSKAIGLAGIRMGFAVAKEKITTALRAAKSPYNTDSISQVIAALVLKEKEYIKEKCNILIQNTQELYKGILEIQNKYSVFEKIYLTRTNFVFIKTDKDELIYDYMLKKSIAIRKFKGFLRINAGKEEENKELLQVLELCVHQV